MNPSMDAAPPSASARAEDSPRVAASNRTAALTATPSFTALSSPAASWMITASLNSLMVRWNAASAFLPCSTAASTDEVPRTVDSVRTPCTTLRMVDRIIPATNTPKLSQIFAVIVIRFIAVHPRLGFSQRSAGP